MLTSSARAIGYIRVSTEQQADSGLGLEAQQTSIAGAALRLGLELSRTFVDAGTSGSLAIEDRPVLLDAVARCAVAMCSSSPSVTAWGATSSRWR